MPSTPLPSRTLTVAPFLCEFDDPASENAFLRHQLAMTQAQLRVAFRLCALCYLCFALSDLLWLGYGLTSGLLVVARVVVAGVVLGCLALLKRRPDSIPLTRVAANVAEVTGALGFLLIAALRPHEFALHAITMSVILIVLYIYVPNRLLYATLIAATATVLFLLLAWTLGQLHTRVLVTMTALHTMCNLFCYVAARRYQILWREEYSAQIVLKNLSVRDPLTGCYNRRHLHEQLLETEISRAQRYQLSLTVIMCDLDHFKVVNDTYGHNGGDAVLQSFARQLQALTRDGVDSVVRYGGEEFLLILPETDLAGGRLLAERLRQQLADAVIDYEGQQIRITASFGVASVDFATAPQAARLNMIAAADDLLYAAKNSGRNRVCAQQLG